MALMLNELLEALLLQKLLVLLLLLSLLADELKLLLLLRKELLLRLRGRLLLEQGAGDRLARRRRWRRSDRRLLQPRIHQRRVEEESLSDGRPAGQLLDVLQVGLRREPGRGQHHWLGHELPLAAQVRLDGDAVIVEVGEGRLWVAAAVVERLVDEGGATAAVGVVQALQVACGLRVGLAVTAAAAGRRREQHREHEENIHDAARVSPKQVHSGKCMQNLSPSHLSG